MGAGGRNLGQIHDRSTTRSHRERAFGDDVTLDFNAHIRGRSSASTPPRPRAAFTSASTRWDRSRPGATPAGAWSSRPTPKRSEQSRRSTTADVAKVMSSAPSGHRGGLHRNLLGPPHSEL